MGDGNTSSHRWQANRKTSWEEKANYYFNRVLALQAANDELDYTCQRQAIEIARLNKAFMTFKKGDEL